MTDTKVMSLKKLSQWINVGLMDGEKPVRRVTDDYRRLKQTPLGKELEALIGPLKTLLNLPFSCENDHHHNVAYSPITAEERDKMEMRNNWFAKWTETTAGGTVAHEFIRNDGLTTNDGKTRIILEYPDQPWRDLLYAKCIGIKAHTLDGEVDYLTPGDDEPELIGIFRMVPTLFRIPTAEGFELDTVAAGQTIQHVYATGQLATQRSKEKLHGRFNNAARIPAERLPHLMSASKPEITL